MASHETKRRAGVGYGRPVTSNGCAVRAVRYARSPGTERAWGGSRGPRHAATVRRERERGDRGGEERGLARLGRALEPAEDRARQPLHAGLDAALDAIGLLLGA